MKIIKSTFRNFLTKSFISLPVLTCIWLLSCQIHYFHSGSNVNQSPFNYVDIITQEQELEKRSLRVANIDNKVHILLCSDKKDRFPMYTLINSIIKNERDIHRLYFHILVFEDIPQFSHEFAEYFQIYLNDISIEFKSIVDDDKECIEYSNIASTTLPEKQKRNWLNNIMNFARFCMPKVFENVNVGIYIDVDMIVETSISLLYDDYYYKNDYIAWSVMNRSPYKTSFKNKEKSQFLNNYFNYNLSLTYPSVTSTEINFSNIRMLFNAGILMFNFDVWRKNNFTEQSIELFKFNKIYSKRWNRKPWNGVTQPILNMLFIINQIKVGDLGKKWNFVIKDLIKGGSCKKKINKQAKRILKRVNILHWAGGCKPWASSNVNTAYIWVKYIPKNVHISDWENELNVTLI